MVDLTPLDNLIARLRRSKDFVARAAPAAAAAVEGVLRATASAGTSPDGAAWEPRVRDGGRALPKAAGAITCKAVGTVLLAKLAFPYSLHDQGQGHAVKRQIMPHGSAPPAVMDAIKRALIDAWRAQ